MDAALLNLVVTIATLVGTLVFRKRLLAALGRLLFDGAVKFVRAEFVDEGVETLEDGSKRAYVRLRPRGEALLGAVLASLMKQVKFKLPSGGGLPAGIDLSNLSSALPAILSSGMIPKRYAGMIALAAPFLQQFMGQPGAKPGVKATENPFAKELEP